MYSRGMAYYFGGRKVEEGGISCCWCCPSITLLIGLLISSIVRRQVFTNKQNPFRSVYCITICVAPEIVISNNRQLRFETSSSYFLHDGETEGEVIMAQMSAHPLLNPPAPLHASPAWRNWLSCFIGLAGVSIIRAGWLILGADI
jgi:hypothetical protein